MKWENSFVQSLVGQAVSKIAEKIEQGYEVELVDEATQAERIAICEGCPRFNDHRICNECGCPMDYKTRLKFNPFRALIGDKELIICPLKKW